VCATQTINSAAVLAAARDLLARMYMIFVVMPFAGKLTRAIHHP
jgi:hypothetical protein